MRTWLYVILTATVGVAQIPFDQLDPSWREEAQNIVQRADFVFETRTPPKKVRLSTMEGLFDHPRLGAAMWRYCRFEPEFYVFSHHDGSWTLDDAKGLRGTMTPLLKKPGMRIYLVEGSAEKGRLKTPFAVGARMVTAYRYWEGADGFESHLQTWTALNSALLGFVVKPFRGYIRHRQEEFIAYINGNVATFGEFAERNPCEFDAPLNQEGDLFAIRDFATLFGPK